MSQELNTRLEQLKKELEQEINRSSIATIDNVRYNVHELTMLNTKMPKKIMGKLKGVCLSTGNSLMTIVMKGVKMAIEDMELKNNTVYPSVDHATKMSGRTASSGPVDQMKSLMSKLDKVLQDRRATNEKKFYFSE